MAGVGGAKGPALGLGSGYISEITIGCPDNSCTYSRRSWYDVPPTGSFMWDSVSHGRCLAGPQAVLGSNGVRCPNRQESGPPAGPAFKSAIQTRNSGGNAPPRVLGAVKDTLDNHSSRFMIHDSRCPSYMDDGYYVNQTRRARAAATYEYQHHPRKVSPTPSRLLTSTLCMLRAVV